MLCNSIFLRFVAISLGLESFHCDQSHPLIRTELHDPPIFDGMRDIEEFMDNLSLVLPEQQLVPVLDTT